MAARGRLPAQVRGPVGPVVPGLFRPGFGPPVHPPVLGQPGLAPSPALIEQKLATQHAEIQRLLTENQRLAATHVALRQELAGAQQEGHRLQQVLANSQAEKEAQMRALLEKQAKMEAELRGADNLKAEVHQVRTDAAKFNAARQELATQVQNINQELQRARMELQQVPALRAENDALRQELNRARTAFEYEKKANSDQLEQRQAMEKNLVTMAREVEKLRAELTNAEKRLARGPGNGGYGAYAGADVGYSMAQYGDGYGIHQMQIAMENGVRGAGPTASWGAYDVQRGGGSHGRR